jgi:DNA-binding phage protein
VAEKDQKTFPQILGRLTLVAQMIELLEGVREDLIVAADETGPHADRKQIASAAGMPPSRLYRLLSRHGRPANRRASKDE